MVCVIDNRTFVCLPHFCDDSPPMVMEVFRRAHLATDTEHFTLRVGCDLGIVQKEGFVVLPPLAPSLLGFKVDCSAPSTIYAVHYGFHYDFEALLTCQFDSTVYLFV
ncbi:hypothetical protein ES703_119800 [subsurface metagenome]